MLADAVNLVAPAIANLGPSRRRLDDFQNWAGVTLVHPIGGAILGVASLLLISLPRRFALIPYLLMMCFSGRQRIVIASLDFDFLRLMIVVGMVRVILRSEYRGFRLTRIDWLVILWTISGTAAFTALHGGGGAFTNRLGNAADTLGAFLVFRCLVRSWDDVQCFARWSVIVALPTACFFFIEKSTGRNYFSIFGGVPEITVVRDGKLRCQGAFSHPILAGSFWAAQIPLYAAVILQRGVSKIPAVFGLASAFFIVMACASSTPLAAIGVGIAGWMLFPLRWKMKKVQLATIAALVFLHIVRQPKPVWHLITRIDLVGGSTGYHRYRLIDAAINRFSEWMLIGTPTTRHWGRGMFDITNHYILEGVRGGALTLLLFVLVLWTAFKHIGVAVRATESDRQRQILAWGVGVTLFVHSVVFIAVSYFGQIVMLYHSHLAMAAGLGLAATVPVAKQVRRAVKSPAAPVYSPRAPGAPVEPALPGLPMPKRRPAAAGGPPATAQPAGPWARALSKRPPEQNSNGGSSDV